jgi:hypothetical protein
LDSELSGLGLTFVGGRLERVRESPWIVFSAIRNERLRLPYFLEYYRRMGAEAFVMLDNGSRDASLPYLIEQPDVVVFRTDRRYSESNYAVDWLNALLHRFGEDRWCLTVDADELLVYPHCERMPMTKLTEHLAASGANGLVAFLLDMYSTGPIRDARCEPGVPLLSACPYFDATGYVREDSAGPSALVPTRGGPRKRLFWDGYTRDRPAPYLPKIPLVFWSTPMSYNASTHLLSEVRVGGVTGVLQHFKLLADFPGRVREEAERGEHFNHASQYAAYWDVISKQPDLSAMFEGSVRYEESRQLIELGLMHSSPALDLLAEPAQGQV